MTFRQDIDKASNASVNSARWIQSFNGVIFLFAILGAPFTMFASLFSLLAIPFNAALAEMVNNSSRQTELTKLHLLLLADKHGLD